MWPPAPECPTAARRRRIAGRPAGAGNWQRPAHINPTAGPQQPPQARREPGIVKKETAMSRIKGGRFRWLLVVGGVAVAAATVGCQSSPGRGPTAADAAPSVVRDGPSSSSGDTVGNRPSAPPAGGKTTNGAPVPKVGGPGGTGPTLPSPTLRPTPPQLPRCHTADLAVEVGQSDSGMGHTGLNLALVNRSTHRCRIYGYGGIQLLDAAGAALPTRQLRHGPAPQLITLRPGGRAYSVLTWIFSTEAPPCSSSTFLLVTPPDETKPIRVAFSATVCGNGQIAQGAYQTKPT